MAAGQRERYNIMGAGDYPGAESMDSVLKAMQNFMPGVIRAITKEQPYVAQVQAETDAAVSPIYAESQRKLYDTEGREINRIGAEIETANQLAASEREKLIAETSGKELVQLGDEFQRMLDPEFYKTRATVSEGQNKLINSMDPTALSPTERAEIERAIGRSGAANPNDAQATAANAMTFGSALAQKQANFGNVVNQVAQTLPATRSGMSGFEIATRRALGPNTGDARFTGTQQNTGQNAWSTGNNVFNQASNLQSIKNQKAKDTMDMVLQGTQAASNVMSSFSF
jgi:hypothetical protein